MAVKATFKFGFSGWRTWSMVPVTPHQARPFRCPECGREVIAQSVMEIACPNCGAEGTKQHFSSVEKKAA